VFVSQKKKKFRIYLKSNKYVLPKKKKTAALTFAIMRPLEEVQI